MKQNRNIEIVQEFYREVIGKQNTAHAKKIVAKDYIQHNPHVKTGRSGLLEAIAYLGFVPKDDQAPKPFMRIFAQGDYVVVHSRFEFAGLKKIVIDLFRLEEGLLVEHWDAIKDESKTSVNGNSEIEGPTLIEDEGRTQKNRALVENFVNEVLQKRNINAVDDYVKKDMIQHRPELQKGISGIRKYAKEVKLLKIHRIVAQGNFVLTQSEAIIKVKKLVVYDIYRVEKGKIAEHWSVAQEIPAKMAHDNGML